MLLVYPPRKFFQVFSPFGVLIFRERIDMEQLLGFILLMAALYWLGGGPDDRYDMNGE